MIKFKLILLPANNIDDNKSFNQNIKYSKLWIYVIMVYGHFIDKGNTEKDNSKYLSQKKIKILVTKLGLDCHDRGDLVISRALRNSDMDVIYSGLFYTPTQL